MCKKRVEYFEVKDLELCLCLRSLHWNAPIGLSMLSVRLRLPSFGNMKLLLSLLALIFSVQLSAADDQYSVVVDGSAVLAPLKHFWESTGFCPPLPHEDFHTYALSDDEYQNLAHIGSVPRQGIAQVRIHWLLDLVTVKRCGHLCSRHGFVGGMAFSLSYEMLKQRAGANFNKRPLLVLWHMAGVRGFSSSARLDPGTREKFEI